MNADRMILLLTTVFAVALVAWKAGPYLGPMVVTPPTPPDPTQPEAVKAPGTVTNVTTSPGIPMAFVMGPAFGIPAAIPWATQRGVMPS